MSLNYTGGVVVRLAMPLRTKKSISAHLRPRNLDLDSFPAQTDTHDKEDNERHRRSRERAPRVVVRSLTDLEGFFVRRSFLGL